MLPLTLEVIATSVEDALEAERGGANRLELVRELEVGGLTPPLDLVDAVLARTRLPVRVMLRETETHDVRDIATRRHLIDLATALAARPVDGLVCGFLTGGAVDSFLTAEIVAAGGPRHVTFHRAFDELNDPAEGVAQLTHISGVDRLLTSGGAGPWAARVARLAQWAALAAPSMTIITGGGVTKTAAHAILAVPALREIHVGRAVRHHNEVSGRVDARLVAEFRALLDEARP